MKIVKKIALAIALAVFVEAVIYFFFAFCNWGINWIPEVGGFVRGLYAFIAFFSCMSAIGFVCESMED